MSRSTALDHLPGSPPTASGSRSSRGLTWEPERSPTSRRPYSWSSRARTLADTAKSPHLRARRSPSPCPRGRPRGPARASSASREPPVGAYAGPRPGCSTGSSRRYRSLLPRRARDRSPDMDGRRSRRRRSSACRWWPSATPPVQPGLRRRLSLTLDAGSGDEGRAGHRADRGRTSRARPSPPGSTRTFLLDGLTALEDPARRRWLFTQRVQARGDVGGGLPRRPTRSQTSRYLLMPRRLLS